MRLAHAVVRRAGFVVHAWAGPEGLAAVRVGDVPPPGAEDGGRPVPGLVIGGTDPRLAELAAALRDYLDGAPLAWDGELDLRGTTAFQREVLAAVREVGHGTVSTYLEIARRVGRPTAVRAVGSALSRNPFPIVVPCHRILRGSGALGGYAGGVAAKRRLLALEAGQIELGLGGDEA